MDILFVCLEPPTAAHPRTHGLSSALARRGHTVTLAFADEAGTTFDDFAEHEGRLLPVRRRQLAEAVAAEARSGRYDLVHVDGAAAPVLHRTDLELPAVLDLAFSSSLRRERALRAQGPFVRAAQGAWMPQLRRDEAAMLGRFSRVIVSTDADAAALRILADGDGAVHVVPSPVDLERFAPPQRLRDPATLLLDLRGLGRHDAAAALTATAMTMATIWSDRADARLTVLGAMPFGAAGRLAGNPRVVFTGPVHDPRGHLMAATLVIAPVESETVALYPPLEALATGTALIVRGAMARDLGAVPGEELLVAESAAEQAWAALSLLDDAPFRGRLGRGGRRLVEREHSAERALSALEQVYAAATGSAMAEWRLELGMDRPRLSG